MNHLKKERKTRKFLGNTVNPSTFDKAELKAYLKGKKIFSHGFSISDVLNLEARRKKYIVRQQLT